MGRKRKEGSEGKEKEGGAWKEFEIAWRREGREGEGEGR